MLRFFMMLQFGFSILGLYFVHFMAPSMEYQFPSWVTTSIIGVSIGTIAATIHKFFGDISDIRAALEARR